MALSQSMRAQICDCCGRDIPETVERLGLRVDKNPPHVAYHGIEVPGLRRSHKAMLYRLCENGRASVEALVWREDTDPANSEAVKVQMSLIRTAFREAGVMLHIAAIDGWGYVLTEFTEAEKADAPQRTIRVRGPDARRLAAALNVLDQPQP